MKKIKIGILHYRIGKTDGVSLEIVKRKLILEKLGYEVKLISGPVQDSSNYIIPLLEFDLPEIFKIRHNAFEKFEDFKDDKDFELYINKVSDTIKGNFLKIHSKENFDYLFLHNIFTHGRHIATAKAFYEIALESNIKIISINHDFYWVGSYKDTYIPTTKFVKKYLKKYSPPNLPNITHVAINSINQDALKKKIHQKSIILPDTFDFTQHVWKKDTFNKDFLKRLSLKENDLLILQATRITKRKGIETAIDFTKQISENKSLLIGKTLYNGKKIDIDSKIVLVLAGYTEKDSTGYKKLLDEKISKENVKALFISDNIGATRETNGDLKKYSLWDAYVFADIVTFPSLWEGWGNQLLEALFAKKPVAVFEYPVFKTDIKKEGYKIISLGDKILNKSLNKLTNIPLKTLKNSVQEAISLLTSKSTKNTLNRNFLLAKKYHSQPLLEKRTKEILKIANSK